MSIADLGALGEFVSSIAVLITLLYLAVQFRQTKEIALRQARDQRANRTLELFLTAADSEHIVPAMTKGEADSTWGFSKALQERGLSNEEAMRMMFWFMAQHRHYETLWRGSFEEDERERMDRNIVATFNHGLGGLYFDHLVSRNSEDAFSNHVVKLITESRKEAS